MKRLLRPFIPLILSSLVFGIHLVVNPSSVSADDSVSASTQAALREAGAQLGNPIFIRVFKRDQEEFAENPSIATSCEEHHPNNPPLISKSYTDGGTDEWLYSDYIKMENLHSRNLGKMEIWIRSSTGRYILLRSFRLGMYSGALGPKIAVHDGQTPEGFYTIDQLKGSAETAYQRAMLLNYPNTYDRSRGHSGSLVEIHGNDDKGQAVAISCISIRNNVFDVYSLVNAAIRSGQKSVPVEIFPFPLKDTNLAKIPDSTPCEANLKRFWRKLQPAYLDFDQTHLPPTISFAPKGDYIVNETLPDMDILNRVHNVGTPPSCPSCKMR